MKRLSEEELMDLPLHAQAYANADFSEPNSKFVALFSEKFPAFNGRHIIDIGCGLADITVRLARRYARAKVVGLDGADAMLEIARKSILRHRFGQSSRGSKMAHRPRGKCLGFGIISRGGK